MLREQIVLAFDVATFLAFFQIAEIPKRNDPVDLRPVTRLHEIIEIEPFPVSVRGRGLSECKFQVVIAFQIQPYDRRCRNGPGIIPGHRRRQTCAADIFERGESIPAPGEQGSSHNWVYGPCPNGQKSPCYSVLILHFFQKALPRPNRESPECEQVPRALRDLLWDFTYLCFNQEGGSVTQASKRGKT